MAFIVKVHSENNIMGVAQHYNVVFSFKGCLEVGATRTWLKNAFIFCKTCNILYSFTAEYFGLD